MIFPKLHINLERWRWNKEHEIYVSTLGNFKNKRKKPVKVLTGHSGYLSVKCKDNKLIAAQRLVMMTWSPIDNPDEMTVDHLDHNKRNNSLKNLEWTTKEENMRRGDEDRAIESKSKKVKFKVTNYTLNHFYLCVNGVYLIEPADAYNFVKRNFSYPSLDVKHIKNLFQNLVNAYNHQTPEYVANNFTKTKYNCEFSIVKKGV